MGSRFFQQWLECTRDASSTPYLLVKFFCFLQATRTHIFTPGLVYGGSMLPTLNMSGDVVLIDRISPRLGKVNRGDVVVVRSPEVPKKVVTKRLVGMEGDTVTYLVDPSNSDRSETIVVPKGHVWVQGDNIYQSRDSRTFGAVPYGLVEGRVFCRIWPPKHFGSL